MTSVDQGLAVLRLRRPFWSPLLAGGALSLLFSPIAAVSLAGAWMLLGENELSSSLIGLAGAAFAIVTQIPLLYALASQVRLGAQLVVSVNLFGRHWIMRDIPCDQIVRAMHGKVAWGRGGPVNGAEVLLTDKTLVEICPSYFIGFNRREDWVAKINKRASAGEQRTTNERMAPLEHVHLREMSRPELAATIGVIVGIFVATAASTLLFGRTAMMIFFCSSMVLAALLNAYSLDTSKLERSRRETGNTRG